MIVIRDVDYYTVQDNITTVIDKSPHQSVFGVKNAQGVSETVDSAVLYKEVVQGRRIVTKDGETVVIGIAADPANVLGLTIDVYENQKQVIKDLEDTVEMQMEFSKSTMDDYMKYSKENLQLRWELNAGFWKTVGRAFKNLWTRITEDY